VSDLAASKRFGLVGLTWALFALAQPGVIRPDGFGHLAFFAIGPWAWAARRPGRRAFLAEWGAHALGLAAVFAWMVEFMPPILLPMSVVPALYPAFAGVLLRRAAAWPLALLAPAAWMLAEVVRWSLPVPLSFGWFRVGMLMHDTAWIVGSAAWFGTWGLTWALAALGGFAADFVTDFSRPEGARSRLLPSIVLGVGPLVGLIALSAAAHPPHLVDGPDILVVQSGIEQDVKAARLNAFDDIYAPQVTRTLEALFATRPEGGPGGARGGTQGDAGFPDLVAWGETFLSGKLVSPEVRAAIERGARPAEWAISGSMKPADFINADLYARDLVTGLLGGGGFQYLPPRFWQSAFQRGPGAEWADRAARGEPLLPPGTGFLSGVEAWTVIETDGHEELRSINGVVIWSPDGSMSEVASKVHLVPGGETGEPLRLFPFILGAIRRVASAIPDFVAPDEPAVLMIPTRGRGTFRAGISICFDNAFDDPYTAPLRRGPVDFFLVVSNEAWYGATAEMDHMLAFTRIAAAASQRSILRATNSGITALVGPDGVLLEVLVDEQGRRKMISGALRTRVPVPDPARDAPVLTFFVRTEPYQRWAWGGLAGLILAAAIVAARRSGQVGDIPAGSPQDRTE